jgi:serine/threonine protein kinase
VAEQENIPRAQEDWPHDALPRDTLINGVRIRRIIGRGGFGITYEAVDSAQQHFALKECYPHQFAVRKGLDVVAVSTEHNEMLLACRDRFLREARALADLGKLPSTGDGVVKIILPFEANGTGYMLMELLSGRTLETLIKARPGGLPADQVGVLMRGVLRALGCMHEAGMLHRDVKPANIALRDDGRPVLIDLGAVRVAHTGLTTVYSLIYTPDYAPIEQIVDGRRQGPASDLYGVGATFYKAIGGTLKRASVREFEHNHGGTDPLQPASEIGAGRYPAGLLTALDAALRIEPEDRPQSVGELLAMMDGDGAGLKEASRPAPEPTSQVPEPKKPPPPAPPEPEVAKAEPVRPRPGINLRTAIAAAVCAVVIGAGIGLLGGRLHPGPAPVPPAPVSSQLPASPPVVSQPAVPPPAAVLPAPAALPPAVSPTQPSGPSQREIERDKEVYTAAHGNAAALRGYVNTCLICTYKVAAQAEVQQLDQLDRERQTYASARGNPGQLRSYANSCQICESKYVALSEAQQIEQERQAYNVARGNLAALRSYVSSCQTCEFKSAAQSEIQQLAAISLPAGTYSAERGYTGPKSQSEPQICPPRDSIRVKIDNDVISFDTTEKDATGALTRQWTGRVDQRNGSIRIVGSDAKPPTKRQLTITGPFGDATVSSDYCGVGFFKISR